MTPESMSNPESVEQGVQTGCGTSKDVTWQFKWAGHMGRVLQSASRSPAQVSTKCSRSQP